MTLSKGRSLLKKAAENLQESLPTLGHGGYDGLLNWFLARFEDQSFKTAPQFHDHQTLLLAAAMGFDVKERRASVQRIGKAMQSFFDDHRSIFTFLRPNLSRQIPREDMTANTVVFRALDGFYKEMTGKSDVEYLYSSKRLQGWIEKKFFAYLLASGDWPIENIDFEDLQHTDAGLKSLPKDRFYQSLQQYFLSVSRKTLLLAYENGLYFLAGEKDHDLIVIGLTHDFDDPMDYLAQQNTRRNYQLKDLRILATRRQKGFRRDDGVTKDETQIISRSPLLFVARLALPK